MKSIFLTLLACLATFGLHANTCVFKDSTLLYLNDPDYDHIPTLKVEKEVTLPDNLSEINKANIMSIIDTISNIKVINGVLKPVESTCADSQHLEVLTPEVKAAIDKEDNEERGLWYDWSEYETIVPQSAYGYLVVLRYDRESYCGGAHGIHFCDFINYSLTEGREITLDEFIDVNNKALATELSKALTKAFKEQMPEAYEFAWNNKNGELVPVSDTFYLSRKGITFVYQEYEIGPYAIGQPELTISFDQLKKILKNFYQ